MPAQEADRRLAVAREDPVLVLERVDRAGLDRLVAPEDRVGADPALAVVDDRALVVGAQQHHRAVEREQLLLADALDLAVGNGVAVADHAAQIALGRNGARHRGADFTGGPAARRARQSAPVPACSPRSWSASYQRISFGSLAASREQLHLAARDDRVVLRALQQQARRREVVDVVDGVDRAEELPLLRVVREARGERAAGHEHERVDAGVERGGERGRLGTHAVADEREALGIDAVLVDEDVEPAQDVLDVLHHRLVGRLEVRRALRGSSRPASG